MVWECHTPRQPLQNALLDTLEVGRRRDQQRKCRMDNIKERTSLPMPELFTMASRGKVWKRICAKSFLMSARRPNRSRDWTELDAALNFALR